jgi:hypothetical protein
MKHWDLIPKETVTLIREDGETIEARFLFRDTARATFQKVRGNHEDLVLMLSADGSLLGLPTKDEIIRNVGPGENYTAGHAAIARGRRHRFVIAGEDRHTDLRLKP